MTIKSKLASATAVFGLLLGTMAVGASAAYANSGLCPTSSGYCIFTSGFGYNLYDYQGTLDVSPTLSTPFAFINPEMWNGHTVYELYEEPTALCVTWNSSSATLYLSSCVKQSHPTKARAAQEFLYSTSSDILVNVGATGYYGPYYCLAGGTEIEATYVTPCADPVGSQYAIEWYVS
jgi:hypothetical protein